MFHGQGPPRTTELQHTTHTVTFPGPARPGLPPRYFLGAAVQDIRHQPGLVKVSGPHWLHSFLRNDLSLSAIVSPLCHTSHLCCIILLHLSSPLQRDWVEPAGNCSPEFPRHLLSLSDHDIDPAVIVETQEPEVSSKKQKKKPFGGITNVTRSSDYSPRSVAW